MKTILKFAFTMVLAVAPAAAQIQIPLDSLAAKASDTAGISLDSSMLKLAANFLGGDKAAQDPEVQKILSGLKSILVRRYSFKEEGQYQDDELAPLRKQLVSTGWNAMITHKRKNEHSEIYTRIGPNQVSGITIVAAKPKEVAVVSVEGAIDLAKLAELAGHFGIPSGITDADGKADSKNPTTDPK